MKLSIILIASLLTTNALADMHSLLGNLKKHNEQIVALKNGNPTTDSKSIQSGGGNINAFSPKPLPKLSNIALNDLVVLFNRKQSEINKCTTLECFETLSKQWQQITDSIDKITINDFIKHRDIALNNCKCNGEIN